jgi:hypothetical protein
MAFEVFTPVECSRNLTFASDPLLTFHSSPEYSHSFAAAHRIFIMTCDYFGCLPCGFFPFDVFPLKGSHFSRSNHASELLPSQRFSRSQGFAPPSSCRSYFIPVPSLRFPFRVDFHSQSETFLRTSLPSCGLRPLLPLPYYFQLALSSLGLNSSHSENIICKAMLRFSCSTSRFSSL